MTTAVRATTAGFTPRTAARSVRMMQTLERLAVFLLAFSLPLENELPTIASRSIPAIMLFAVGGYVLVFHWRRLIRTAMHPFFAAAMTFVVLAVLLEYTHEVRQFVFATRTLQMFFGALIVASLCRDKETLNYGIAGVLLSGTLLSLAIVFGAYGKIADAQVASFQEASALRRDVFIGTALNMGLNRMSFLCGEAAVVGMALMLQSEKRNFRFAMAGLAIVSLLGTFLLFSRGGAVIAGVGGSIVFLLFRGKNVRRIMLAALVVVSLTVIVPDSVFQRLRFGPQVYASGKMEGRTVLYTAAFAALPEYAFVGVGEGPYWEYWAMGHGMEHDGHAVPAHNTPLQIMMYWGLPALCAFLLVLFMVGRSLPWDTRGDPRALTLFGMAACESVRLLVSHTFYEKSLTITFGLIIGSCLFVWNKRGSDTQEPARISHPAARA